MLQLEAGPVRSFRPPAPRPQQGQLGFFRLLATLKRNPLECWSQEFFEEPIASVKLPFVQTFLVHDPAAIKRVLVDNASNCHKDPIQRRILSLGLADGLLNVEEARWKMQRRTLAPLFARRPVASFTQAMLDAVDHLSASWRTLASGNAIDVATELTRLNCWSANTAVARFTARRKPLPLPCAS